MADWPRLRSMRWSDAEAERFYASGLWTPKGIDALLADNASLTPEKLAYDDGRTAVTFAELNARSLAVAAGLCERGVSPGAVVAARMGNSVEHFVLAHAIAAAGAVLFELPPDATTVQVAESLRRTGAVAFFSDIPVEQVEVEALASPGIVGSSPDEIATVAGGDLPGQDPDAVSLLMGTSGTTGTPKIAMRTMNGSLALSRHVIMSAGLDSDDVLMVAAPLSGGVGYFHSLCSAAVMGSSVILPGSLAAEGLIELIERHRVTSISTLPTIAGRMAASDAAERFDTSSLEIIQSGGAYVPTELAAKVEERLDCRITSLYGATDLGSPAMISVREDSAEQRHTTVGRRLPEVEYGLMNEEGELVPVGETGEVVMRGPNTAVGYYRDKEATRTLFDDEGWGHFGDLGRVGEDGYLRIVGRLKEIINRGGKKISINEIEDHVQAFPGVVDVAAVGYDDADLGERCAVVVVTEGDVVVTVEELQAFLTERGVAKHKWPERIVHYDELPMSPQGKVRRRELREAIQEEST